MILAFLLTLVMTRGETLDYNVRWLFFTGGTLQTTIASIDATRCRIASVGSSRVIIKINDQIESIVSCADLSTLEYNKHLEERGQTKDDRTSIDAAKKVATRVRPDRSPVDIPVPVPIYDPLSMIYHLRELDLTPGTVHHFPVIADGKVFTVEAKVGSVQTLKTEAGTFRTVRVETRMDDRKRTVIWFAEDEPHVPIRIDSEANIGTISATLRGVH